MYAVSAYKDSEYTKENLNASKMTLFNDIDIAANYFSEKFDVNVKEAKLRIKNDTNCDWVILKSGKVAYFEY